MALDSFEETYVERDDAGNLWVKLSNGVVVCEAFYKSPDETTEEMMAKGYVPVPYLFEDEYVFVEVDPQD